MAAKGKPPEILQLSTAELEQLLAEVRPLLSTASYSLIESLLRTLVWIMGLLEQKETTIARSGNNRMHSLISLRFNSSGRSLISSILLKPITR